MWLSPSPGTWSKLRRSCRKQAGSSQQRRKLTRSLRLEPLESRAMLADYTINAAGTASGNGMNNAVADDFRLVLNSGRTAVVAYINGIASSTTMTLSGLGRITIEGSGDNDTLTLDDSNGIIAAPNGIIFTGAAGTNRLVVSGGSTCASETYDAAAGVDAITDAVGNTQTVTFTNIQSTLSTTPVSGLVVAGTSADNVINYTEGASTATGKVSVDSYASFEFSGKTTVDLVGGSGTDTITLGNPSTPNGLSNVLVNAPTLIHRPTLDDIASPAAVGMNAVQQCVTISNISAGETQSQTLQVSVSSDNPTLIPGATVRYTSPSSAGSIVYTPASNQMGTAHLTVTVRDSGLDGTLGNGDDLSISKSFAVVVTTPIPPVLAPVLWLDASTLNLADQAVVTGLTDWSASHNNAVSTGSPTFNLNGLNGRGTIHITGSQSLVTTANIGITGGADRSMFAVLRRNGDSSSGIMPIQTGNDVAGHGWGITSQPNGIWSPYIITMGGSDAGPRTAGVYEVYSALHQSGSTGQNFGYVNGSPLPVGNCSPDINTVAGPLFIGVGPITTQVNGDFAEVLVYNRLLSTAERQAVETYLTNKWINTTPNQPPTLAAIADPAAINTNAGTQTVSLSGIGDGDDGTQRLQVTATSDNTSVVADPTVWYSSPDSTGTLHYQPAADHHGTAHITVTVRDSGPDGAIGTIDDASSSQAFTVVVNNTAALVTAAANKMDNGQADDFRLVLNASHTNVDVYLDNVLSQSLPLAGLSKITVQGSADTDTLTIDANSGLIPVPIEFNGGKGTNGLTLIGGTTATSEIYDAGAGTDTITAGSVTQTVTLVSVQSIISTVPVTDFSVNGTSGNDRIIYSSSKITVNSYASIEISNKTNVAIHGQAGNDLIETSPTSEQDLIDGPGQTWAGNLVPDSSPFPQSSDFTGIQFTGRHALYTYSDTWYPSWGGPNGDMYSTFQDGTVDDAQGNPVFVWGDDHTGNTGNGPGIASTGVAKITGNDPMNLGIAAVNVVRNSYASTSGDYTGRYPSGNLMADNVWYVGTYGAIWKTSPFRLGPFAGFSYSTDFGATWTPSPFSLDLDGAMFPEDQQTFAGPLKLAVPAIVDFGQNMEYAPRNAQGQKMAYMICAGEVQIEPTQYNLDQYYMIRVPLDPEHPESINDPSRYEFLSGYDASGNATWSYDFNEIQPVATWNARCSSPSIVYDAPLNKYFMYAMDGKLDISTKDTYILESDNIAGPYKMVGYLPNLGEQAYYTNVPSKFISSDGLTGWMVYASDFTRNQIENPPGSGYHFNLFEFKLLSPDATPINPLLSPDNVARTATVTVSSERPLMTDKPLPPVNKGFGPAGLIDGSVFSEGPPDEPNPQNANWVSLETVGASVHMSWTSAVSIDHIWLFNRPEAACPGNREIDQIMAGTLTFSDGSSIQLTTPLPDDGMQGVEVWFAPKTVTSLTFTVTATAAGAEDVGLAELGVFRTGSLSSHTTPSSITIDAGDGDDSINLNNSASSPTTINGGNGADTLALAYSTPGVVNHPETGTITGFGSLVTYLNVETVRLSEPSELPAGIVLQLDASTLNLANGAPVTGLTDLSAQHNNTVANGTPTFTANGLNGKGTIHFTGSQNLHTLANIGIYGGADRSVFVVMRRNGTGSMAVQMGDNGTYTGWGVTSQSNGIWVPYTNGTGGVSPNPNIARTAGTYELYDALHATEVPPGSATNYGYINGTLIGTNANTPNINTTVTPFYVGAGQAIPSVDGDLAEVIVYNRMLTDDERRTVESYLNAKWFPGGSGLSAASAGDAGNSNLAATASTSSPDSDILIVVGRPSANDAITITSTGSQTGTVNYNVAGMANVTFSDIKGLTLAAQASDSDVYTSGGPDLGQGQESLAIDGATLQFDTGDTFSTTVDLTITGQGSLDLGGTTATVHSVTLESGSLNNGTLVSDSQTVKSGTVNATLQSTAGLNKSDSGVVTLSAPNSYTGDTVVTGGQLTVAAADALPASTTLIVGSNGTVVLSSSIGKAVRLKRLVLVVDNSAAPLQSSATDSPAISTLDQPTPALSQPIASNIPLPPVRPSGRIASNLASTTNLSGSALGSALTASLFQQSSSAPATNNSKPDYVQLAAQVAQAHDHVIPSVERQPSSIELNWLNEQADLTGIRRPLKRRTITTVVDNAFAQF